MMLEQRPHKRTKVRRLVHEENQRTGMGATGGGNSRLLEKRDDRFLFRIVDAKDGIECGQSQEVIEEGRRGSQTQVAAAVSGMRKEPHQQAHASAVHAGYLAGLDYDPHGLAQAAVDAGFEDGYFFAGHNLADAPDHKYSAAVA